MKILITNIWLCNYGGTECYVRDLSLTLKSKGIEVEIYSPKLGRIAQDIRSAGINIVNSVSALKNIPDLIHGHHCVTMDTINKFTDVPVIYFCHGIAGAEEPLIHTNIKKYVVVSEYVKEYVGAITQFENKEIRVVYNWVDTDRFKQKEIINIKPETALIFSNSIPQEKVKIIISACASKNIAIHGIGGHVNNNIQYPERLLKNYDIVFAVGKSAIESMACGCSVILCDSGGLGEIITPDNFDYCRTYNFGLKNLTNEITTDLLVERIGKYNSIEAKEVSDKIRQEASFDKSVQEIISLYNKVLANG